MTRRHIRKVKGPDVQGTGMQRSKIKAVADSIEFRMAANLRPVQVAAVHWLAVGDGKFKHIARIWLNPLKRTYFCADLLPGREFMQLFELQIEINKALGIDLSEPVQEQEAK